MKYMRSISISGFYMCISSLNENNPYGTCYPKGWHKLPRIRSNLCHRVGGKILIYISDTVELYWFIFALNED